MALQRNKLRWFKTQRHLASKAQNVLRKPPPYAFENLSPWQQAPHLKEGCGLSQQAGPALWIQWSTGWGLWKTVDLPMKKEIAMKPGLRLSPEDP